MSSILQIPNRSDYLVGGNNIIPPTDCIEIWKISSNISIDPLFNQQREVIKQVICISF